MPVPPRPRSGRPLLPLLGGGLLLLGCLAAAGWGQAPAAALVPVTSQPADPPTATVRPISSPEAATLATITPAPPPAPSLTPALTATPAPGPVSALPTAGPTPAPDDVDERLAVADSAEAEPVATPTAPAAAPSPTATAAPVGPPRIGLQVGHWRSEELPDELARLRTSTGGSGGGVREVDYNLLVAERLATRLRTRGFIVDVLPATVPPAYQADLFLAIHADANTSPAPRGFKLARSRWTRLPQTDQALLSALREEYGQATGLPWDENITRNMTGYYAFNNRRRQHAIQKTTPAVILEMGYLTNPADRALLLTGTDRVLEGIERGLVRFLEGRPAPEAREQPATTGAAIIIAPGGASVRSAPRADAPIIDRFEGDRRVEAPELAGDWYGVWVAERNIPGWIHRSEATLVEVPLP